MSDDNNGSNWSDTVTAVAFMAFLLALAWIIFR